MSQKPQLVLSRRARRLGRTPESKESIVVESLGYDTESKQRPSTSEGKSKKQYGSEKNALSHFRRSKSPKHLKI